MPQTKPASTRRSAIVLSRWNRTRAVHSVRTLSKSASKTDMGKHNGEPTQHARPFFSERQAHPELRTSHPRAKGAAACAAHAMTIDNGIVIRNDHQCQDGTPIRHFKTAHRPHTRPHAATRQPCAKAAPSAAARSKRAHTEPANRCSANDQQFIGLHSTVPALAGTGTPPQPSPHPARPT